MSIRKMYKILTARPTVEGNGVHLKRAFGIPFIPELDPFLLLDDFHSNKPEDYNKGFPWHPHRGIETITYVLEGKVEHSDSLGHKGVINGGEVQWMTAGSGIIHQEMPEGEFDGRMWGMQLWANLPSSRKMMEPRYREIKVKEIPFFKLDSGVEVGVICGQINGAAGPVRDIVIDPEYLDITIPPDTFFTHKVKEGYTVFAYVLEGSGCFGLDAEDPLEMNRINNGFAEKENLVIFKDGDEVIIGSKAGVRFLLISGKPIKERVAWYGPIVMNTEEELDQAIAEYQNGTFLKHK